MWMNHWDIEESVERYASHAVLGRAARFLKQFKDEVNEHSDGWAYWQAPAKAAAKLMALIQSGDATEAQFKAALVPIKAFYTRRGTVAGMKWPSSFASIKPERRHL